MSAHTILWEGIQTDRTHSAEENWQHSLPPPITGWFLGMTRSRQDAST
jgi:hypothetical protein